MKVKLLFEEHANNYFLTRTDVTQKTLELTKGYISKMVNSRNRINEKIIFLHVSNTEEICDLVHSFLD